MKRLPKSRKIYLNRFHKRITKNDGSSLLFRLLCNVKRCKISNSRWSNRNEMNSQCTMQKQVFFFITLLATVVLSRPEKQQFTICSRVVTVLDSEGEMSAAMNNNAGLQDPLDCSARVDEEDNNSELSSCRTSFFKTRPNSSAFVREIRIGEEEGSLRAFVLEDDSADSSSRLLCFQLNLSRGASELADDSPRCMEKEGGVFFLFLTRQCEMEVCRMSYLALTSQSCASQSDANEPVLTPETEVVSPNSELEG